MGKLLFLIAFLFSGFVHAQEVNLLKNPNFESRTSQWSRTGSGTFTIESASPLEGSYSANWDASATGEFFRSSTYTIPVGLKGRRCNIDMEYLWDSGVSGHIVMNVDDGTNNIATFTVAPTSGGVSGKASQTFECPTSGTLRFELESTADAAAITLDKMYLGSARNLISAQPQDMFSAKISATDVVSDENIDWINGNCTDASNGDATCIFKTGIFSQAPNCTCAPNEPSGSGQCRIGAISSTQVTFHTNDNTGTSANDNMIVSCQKVESAANREALTVETTGAIFNAYHDDTCEFTISGALGETTADATCALTTIKQSGGISCVTSTTTNPIPGLDCTASVAGTYEILVSGTLLTRASVGSLLSMRLYDRTNSAYVGKLKYAKTAGSADGSARYNYSMNVTMDLAAGSVRSFNIHTSIDGGSGTLYGPEWTVKPVNQQMPAPVFTELQNIMKAGGNGYKTVTAYITNAGTPAVGRQDGNWIASLVDNGTGDTTINIQSGVFNSTPNCFCTSYMTAFGSCHIDNTTAISNVLVRVQTAGVASGTSNDNDFFISCTGPQ